MDRGHAIAGDDPHRVHRGDDRHRVVGQLSGNRVLVGVEADQGQRVDTPRLNPGGDEGFTRQGQQHRPLLVEELGLGCGLTPEPTCQVLAAPPLEVGVQRFEPAVDDGHRHQEAAAGEADKRLYVPFLVGPPHQTEVILEEMMTLESEERIGHLPVAASGDLGDGDLGVVIADSPGSAPEEGEGPDVPLEERLGALAGEGTDEGGVGVRQGHHEQGDSGGLAVEQ